ncbi:glycosyl hydrolase 53 family protein [Actinospica sp. MGRD01-02]|uniref:Arabinogalactan endo-beta-1,4-galactanase n=1 Tax=Actinospica acidithermotolerans TaxID=2828514 RepID=A0A941IJH8_9ACTN|nr:glycosyl hydrolase 53 family protein [Actinospica acidithermotolerans]MBR7830775.1 glycosyl hydrolase 53 family protein [Actinospica acidithermotolerans]
MTRRPNSRRIGIRRNPHGSASKLNPASRTGRVLAALALALAGTFAAEAPAHATTTTPTVTNPGFESNGTGTSTPTGWTASGTTSASYTESGGHSGSYRLTHYSSSAYTVDTYQEITNITPGYYTLGVWVRTDDTGGSNYVTMSSCGSSTPKTYVPVDEDGDWLHIVTYTYVSGNTCYIDFHSASAAGAWTNYDDVTFTAGSAPIAVRGGDVSSLDRGEADGGVYYTSSGTQENALQILSAAGMDYVRLRVWVNPANGFDDEAQLLAMAKQAYTTYGLPILLDLHYSDTWADPGHQTTPAAWASDSLSTLETQVYNYSKQIVGDLVAQGTPPAMVQVGNEINAGMLWPDGETSNWAQLAALLKEGVAGVKAADSSSKIMLHLSSSDDLATLETWYTNAVNYGISFDVIGISYYDYWHGRLDVLQTDLDGLAAKYGKQVAVAETAYPWTMTSGDSLTPSFDTSSELDPGYAASEYGQMSNFRDVMSIVQAVPNGLGLGAFYWEPTWTVVSGNGWDPTDSSSQDAWENQAMFNYSDTGLSVINDFAAR